MIVLRVDGEEYNGYTEISCTESIDNFCRQMKVVCSSENGGFMFPILVGAYAEILVDGTLVFQGNIEESTGESGGDSFEINTGSRDSGSQILRSKLRPDVNFRGPISLESIIKQSLKKMGIVRGVFDETGGIDDFTKREIASEDVGTGIFDYWLDLARQRNSLVSTRRNGDVRIFQPGQTKYQKKLYNLINDIDGVNNIVSNRWKFSISERCHEYNVHSQTNRASEDKKSPPGEGEVDADPNKEVESDALPDTRQRRSDILSEMNFLDPESERFRVLNEELELIGGSFVGGSSGQQNFRRSRVATRGTAFDNSVPPGSVHHEIAEHQCDDDECQRLANWKANKTRAESFFYSCRVAGFIADGEPWEAGWLVDVIDEVANVDSTLLIKSVEYLSAKDNRGLVTDEVILTMTLPDAYTNEPTASESLIQINKIGENWNKGIAN